MSDLTTVRDHPAALLDAEARAIGDDPSSEPGSAEHTGSAAAHLRGYEHENRVTFAALDNDALAGVREAYARSQNTRDLAEIIDAQADLASAVRDLLGLDDDLPEPVDRLPSDDAPPADDGTVRVLTDAADVTAAVLAQAERTFTDWFDNGEPIDWESFLDRMEDPHGYGVAGRFTFDEMDNAAIRKIQKHVRAYKAQG